MTTTRNRARQRAVREIQSAEDISYTSALRQLESTGASDPLRAAARCAPQRFSELTEDERRCLDALGPRPVDGVDLRWCCGVDADGEPVIDDFGDEASPHLLWKRGSGNSDPLPLSLLVAQLCARNSSDRLQVVLMDRGFGFIDPPPHVRLFERVPPDDKESEAWPTEAERMLAELATLVRERTLSGATTPTVIGELRTSGQFGTHVDELLTPRWTWRDDLETVVEDGPRCGVHLVLEPRWSAFAEAAAGVGPLAERFRCLVSEADEISYRRTLSGESSRVRPAFRTRTLRPLLRCAGGSSAGVSPSRIDPEVADDIDDLAPDDFATSSTPLLRLGPGLLTGRKVLGAGPEVARAALGQDGDGETLWWSERPLFVVGGTTKQRQTLVRAVLLQLAYNNSPERLALWLAGAVAVTPDQEGLRHLPHVYLFDGVVAEALGEDDPTDALLGYVRSELQRRGELSAQEVQSLPRTFVVLDDSLQGASRDLPASAKDMLTDSELTRKRMSPIFVLDSLDASALHFARWTGAVVVAFRLEDASVFAGERAEVLSRISPDYALVVDTKKKTTIPLFPLAVDNWGASSTMNIVEEIVGLGK